MRRILFFILVILVIFNFLYSKVNINSLVKYGDRYYKINDDLPYSGIVFDLYKDTGNYKLRGNIKNGLMDSLWYLFSNVNSSSSDICIHNSFVTERLYSLGKIMEESHYVDCILKQYISFYDNGNKKEEQVFNKSYLQEYKTFYENSNIKEIIHYDENGFAYGVPTSYYENGQINQQIIYKYNRHNNEDSFYNSKFFRFYPNGQQKYIVNFDEYKIEPENFNEFVIYHENGNLKCRIPLKNVSSDLPLVFDGLVQEYYDNNVLKSKQLFINGIPLDYSEYSQDTNLIKQYTCYINNERIENFDFFKFAIGQFFNDCYNKDFIFKIKIDWYNDQGDDLSTELYDNINDDAGAVCGKNTYFLILENLNYFLNPEDWGGPGYGRLELYRLIDRYSQFSPSMNSLNNIILK